MSKCLGRHGRHPGGHTGAEVAQKRMLYKSEVVRRNVVPGAISNPDSSQSSCPRSRSTRVSRSSTRRFSTPSQRGILAQLTGVQRAIATPRRHCTSCLRAPSETVTRSISSPRSGVGGADTLIPSPASFSATSRCFAHPAEAPETSSKISPEEGDLAVMLKVTDTQVQKLHWVFTAATKWHLELRPGTDAADSPENVESWYSCYARAYARSS